MIGLRHRFLGLCLPPLIFCVLDTSLTLAGQSSVYWSGNYEHVNEASPTFNHLLAAHPLAFGLGILVWMLVFSGIIILLPDTLALIVSIAVTFGHTLGALTWLLWEFSHGYQAANGLVLLAAIVLGVCILFGWQAVPREDLRLSFLPTWLRWMLIGVLFAIGVYLFLWPRSV